MVRIEQDGYVFDVKLEKTKRYYETHSICDCAGCRNFYAQIRGKYPKLEEFLSGFGVDIARPDEMPWLALNGRIDYTPIYTVTGSVAAMGEHEIDIGSLNIVIKRGDDPLNYIPNEQTEPYFIMEVYNMDLPWVLEEPYPEESALEQPVSIFQKIKNWFRRS